MLLYLAAGTMIGVLIDLANCLLWALSSCPRGEIAKLGICELQIVSGTNFKFASYAVAGGQ